MTSLPTGLPPCTLCQMTARRRSFQKSLRTRRKCYVLKYLRDRRTKLMTFQSYYLMRGGSTHDGKTQKVEAFPNGFQMIAGSNFRRNTTIPDPDPNPLGPWPDSSQDDLAQRAIGFNCLNYHGVAEPALQRHKLPNKDFLDANCADGVRLEMQFPSPCPTAHLMKRALSNAHTRLLEWRT